MIKKSGVLCGGCNLIGHITCVVDFPPHCITAPSSYTQYMSQGDLLSPTGRFGSPTPSTPPPFVEGESGINRLLHWRKPRPSFDGKPRPSFDGKPRPSLDGRPHRPSMDSSRPRPSIDGTPPRLTVAPNTPKEEEPAPRPRRTSLFGRSNHALDRSARSRASVASSAQSSSGTERGHS